MVQLLFKCGIVLQFNLKILVINIGKNITYKLLLVREQCCIMIKVSIHGMYSKTVLYRI